jgi:hypothetical protein
MARSLGLALAPWSVLASGKLRTDAEEQRRKETGEKGRTMRGPEWERTEDEVKMSRALEKIAKEIGAKSISAGKFTSLEILGTPLGPPPVEPLCVFLNVTTSLTLFLNSRHRVRHAENTVRLPHHWWSQG